MEESSESGEGTSSPVTRRQGSPPAVLAPEQRLSPRSSLVPTQAGTAGGVPGPHPWSWLRGRQTGSEGPVARELNVHGKEHSLREGPRPLACVTSPRPSEADGTPLLFQMGKQDRPGDLPGSHS